MPPDYRRPGTNADQIRAAEEAARRERAARHESEIELTRLASLRPAAARGERESWWERHARGWDAVKKIGGGLLVVISLCSMTWRLASDAAVSAVVERLTKQIDPLCLRPAVVDKDHPKPDDLSARFTAIDLHFKTHDAFIDDPNNPQSKLGKKLDNVDALMTELLGKSINTPAPPTVGPTAKQQGRR